VERFLVNITEKKFRNITIITTHWFKFLSTIYKKIHHFLKPADICSYILFFSNLRLTKCVFSRTTCHHFLGRFTFLCVHLQVARVTFKVLRWAPKVQVKSCAKFQFFYIFNLMIFIVIRWLTKLKLISPSVFVCGCPWEALRARGWAFKPQSGWLLK
jgi:hypothetical protein